MVNGRVPLVQVLVGEGLGVVVEEVEGVGVAGVVEEVVGEGLGVVVEEVEGVGVAGVVEEEVLISVQLTAPTPHVYFPSGHERQTSMSAL